MPFSPVSDNQPPLTSSCFGLKETAERDSWGHKAAAHPPPAPRLPPTVLGAGLGTPFTPFPTLSRCQDASPGEGARGAPWSRLSGRCNLGRNYFLFAFRSESEAGRNDLSECMPIIVRPPFKAFQAFKDYSKHLKWASI